MSGAVKATGSNEAKSAVPLAPPEGWTEELSIALTSIGVKPSDVEAVCCSTSFSTVAPFRL